jgi:potassium-transporting ATPase potassium-binding subunit
MKFQLIQSFYIDFFTLILMLIVCFKPLGTYMANVFNGQKTIFSFFLSPIEDFMYKIIGVSEKEEMDWKHYAFAILVFSFLSCFISGLMLYVQAPIMGMKPLEPNLIFNTIVSFVTNTNWQAYSPEKDIHHYFQGISLGVQQFLSPSVGICVLIVLIRGFTTKNSNKLGNFWVDLIRVLLYVIIPLASIAALIFGFLGVPQDWAKEVTISSLEAGKTQNYLVGPIASWIGIEILGSNGGGIFGMNMAHPFQNPNPLTHFFGLFLILLLPTSLCYTFGKMVNDTRQGWAIFSVMLLIFIPITSLTINNEHVKISSLSTSPLEMRNGSMEGKETRNGIIGSLLWASATTATSNGSIAADHSSFAPLNNFLTMFLMQLSETIFGGVGSGLYGMLIFVLIAVFMAGLMVGRTPEYLGKKISAYEMKMVSLALLMPLFLILSGAWILLHCLNIKELSVNQGAQIFSEFMYNVTSASNNNGSSMPGITMNDSTSNLLLGFLMLMGRFWIIIPVLALAGSLAQKNIVPVSSGTLPTHTPLFVFVLISILLIVGVLTFIPSLALGPIAENLGLAGAH